MEKNVYIGIAKNISIGIDTLPETNIAPENGCLEDYLNFGMAYFQGLYVSFREGIQYTEATIIPSTKALNGYPATSLHEGEGHVENDGICALNQAMVIYIYTYI